MPDIDSNTERQHQHRAAARVLRRQGAPLRAIRETLPDNPATNRPWSTASIHQWTLDVVPPTQKPDSEVTDA